MAKHCAVNGPRIEVKRGRAINMGCQRVQVRCFDRRVRQRDLCKAIHHIAKDGPNGTSAGACFLLQLVFERRGRGRAHNDGLKLFIIIYASDVFAICEHALVLEEPKRKIFGVIPDRHGGDDFTGIQEYGQGPFFDHAQINDCPVLVFALHSTR